MAAVPERLRVGAGRHPRAQTAELPDAAGGDHRSGQRHHGGRGDQRAGGLRRRVHGQGLRVGVVSGGADCFRGTAEPPRLLRQDQAQQADPHRRLAVPGIGGGRARDVQPLSHARRRREAREPDMRRLGGGRRFGGHGQHPRHRGGGRPFLYRAGGPFPRLRGGDRRHRPQHPVSAGFLSGGQDDSRRERRVHGSGSAGADGVVVRPRCRQHNVHPRHGLHAHVGPGHWDWRCSAAPGRAWG